MITKQKSTFPDLYLQGAGCSPMGGNVCRAIHSRYCGGNLHFNEDVRAKIFLGLINDTHDFAFFSSFAGQDKHPNMR